MWLTRVGQHVPQADGPILPPLASTMVCGNRCGDLSLWSHLSPRCPSARVGGEPWPAFLEALGPAPRSQKQGRGGSGSIRHTPPMALTWSIYTVVMAPSGPAG